MTERSNGSGGVPGPAVVSDGSGALTLEAVPHPVGPVVVHAAGEVDTATAPFLSEQLRAWFPVAPTVVLDLSRVASLSSAGLSVLLTGTAEATDRGVAFRLVCGDSRPVRRVLQVTGLLERLDVLDPVPPDAGAPGGPPPPLFAVPARDDDRS